MSNAVNDNNSYKDKLSEKYNQLKKNISDLQDVEKYMFENLNKIDKTNATTHEEAIIKARITELSDVRKSLFEQLKDLYMDNTNQTESSREDLIDKLTMKDVLTQELGNVNERINNLETEKTNKQRLVEMGDYEFDRYSSHISLFKIFTYSILFILIILLLVNYLGFPMAIAKLFIILIIAVLIYFSAQKMFYNFVRSPINFNRFNQGSTSEFQMNNDLTNQNSILDNNLSFFDRLFNRDVCGYNLKDSANKFVDKVSEADIKVKVTNTQEKFTNPIYTFSEKIDSIFNVKPLPYSEHDTKYHKI
tara:strand:- start:78 stop:992 length:915 start_codon:yes stop_codon:yes gene_type:complete